VRSTLLPRLILASASPRRREMLERVGLPLEVRPSEVDETQREDEKPHAYAQRLAAEKARTVARGLTGADKGRPVLGADTIVFVDDGGPPILGKPKDAEDARVMLTRLQGRTHQVVTAYHLTHGSDERGRAVETDVEFRPLSPAELEGYIGSGEWEGKAGGYAIQGIAGAFVRTVRGSYTNVVGLPLCEVMEDLDALSLLPADWALGKRP
jgi:septum formation protein